MGRKAAGIEKRQIKVVHAIAGRLELGDDLYRGILADRYRAESSKELTRAQAADFIKHLKSLAEAKGVSLRRRKKYSLRPGMATPKQLYKIEAMWRDVSRQKTNAAREKALRQFLLNRFGIESPEFIPRDAPGKIIATLTAMRRQKSQATGGSKNAGNT